MSDNYQLKKIILIDSFWAGKTVLLNLDGHTNLSGTNGAGKTTFLRLMQLFWGERPSNIVGSTGSKQGFLEYYLPRNSSYLIYQYQRPYQQMCHVMIQSDGRGARYKFIDAPYDKSIYVDENNIPRDSASVDRLYRGNTETSKLMSVDDYCSVIQCHQVSNAKKSLRLLQRRFAMAASPITHIEKVISSVIEKIGDFDTIKQMLIDISRDKLSHNLLDQEQDKIPFQLNKQHIDAWLADLNAARELEAKREDFDALLQTVGTLKDTLNELSHIHYLALKHHKSTEAELTVISQSIAKLKNHRKQLKDNYEQQWEPKDDELRSLNGQIKDLKFEIESLEDQKLKYESQDAESYAIKGSLLDQHVLQQKNIKEEIDALENESKEIKDIYEQQLIELKHHHSNQNLTFDNQRTEEHLAKQKKLTEAKEFYQQRKEQLVQDKEARLKPVNEKKSQLKIKFGVTKASLDNIPIPDKLDKQISKTQQELEIVRKEIKLAYQAQYTGDTNYNSALANYQDIARQLKVKKTELNNAQKLHTQCLKHLSPEDGTLQFFLENEVADWEQNIGRVIAPELLESKDLNPKLTESELKDFYGLDIDLEILADRANLTADKTSLKQQEKLLFSQLEDLNNEIKQIEASLSAANNTREQCQTEQRKTKQHVDRINQKETNLQTEEESLKNQIKAEKEKKRTEIENEINRLSQEIDTCESNIKTIASEYTNVMGELNSEHLSRESIIESDTENIIKAIDAQLETETSHVKQEQHRINQQLKSDLRASGADDTIIELSKKLDVLKSKEKDAKQYQEWDEKYQTWLKKQWQQHPTLCQLRSTYKQQAYQLGDAIKQLERDFKINKAKLNGELNTQESQQEKNQRLLTQLGNSMDQLKNCSPVLSESLPEYAASTLPGLTQTTLQKRKQQTKTIDPGKQVLLQLFNKHHRSQLAEAWQKAMELSSSSQSHFQAEALEIEQPLINVLHMVANVKQATSQQIELHATDVNAFYSHLRQFERIIKQTGTFLSKHVSEEQYFAALGEITVKVRSKMNDLEYWQALKSFGENFEQYKDQAELSGDNEIPNTLIEAMGELTSLLPATGVKIKHLTLFDIEFSIMENGHIKHARNAKELKDVSSSGLSYLALITFFTGVTSMLRKQNSTVVCWPIDELGDLAPENIEAMMTMLERQNIHILSATPTADRHVLSLFNRRYQLDKQKLHEVNLPESKLDKLLNQLKAEAPSHV